MLAQRWSVPHTFARYEDLLDSGLVDAVIILTRNDLHYPLTLAALERGLHVLCEKPLGLTYAEAAQMAARADTADAICMTPFTYRYMPVNRSLKRLIDEGYHRPAVSSEPALLHRLRAGGRLQLALRRRHLGLRRAGRHRLALPLPGLVVLRRHHRRLRRTGTAGRAGATQRSRRALPAGRRQRHDHASVCERRAGAAPCIDRRPRSDALWPDSRDGPARRRRHAPCARGLGRASSASTARVGDDSALRELPIPDEIWQGVRHDTVHNTYRDVFRTQETMTRQWVSAIARGAACAPGLRRRRHHPTHHGCRQAQPRNAALG